VRPGAIDGITSRADTQICLAVVRPGAIDGITSRADTQICLAVVRPGAINGIASRAWTGAKLGAPVAVAAFQDSLAFLEIGLWFGRQPCGGHAVTVVDSEPQRIVLAWMGKPHAYARVRVVCLAGALTGSQC
jgi:hypothetical protein